ncbi:MAG: DUF839 domain-containing protein [Betaproteobacteria bacterium]|nr:MAG: DUF839 domain-containing protein [Betaproteobacteria bacterium]
MQTRWVHALVVVGVFSLAAGAQAATTNFSSFTALPSSVAAGSLPEAAPFQFGNPAWTQTSIADRATQLAAGQPNPGTWDMIDANRGGADAGRYLFTVFETYNAGVQRTDRWTGSTVTLWTPSVPSGAYGFDGVRWTRFGTLITAEEDWGPQPQPYGRLFELTNPTTAAAGSGNLVHRNAVARVAHEGLAFDKDNNLYYVDELNGGSIYRYSSATPGIGSTYFSGGTNSVLRVGDGNTDGATGSAGWVSFTDAAGIGLPGAVSITDPNGITSVDGRASTDLPAFKGTNYERPEDLEIQTLANGAQTLYIATTGSHQVYSLNLSTLQMQVFASRMTPDAATGLPVGSAFSNPDNLAIDADGNIYIVEDQPGGSTHIWFATDADRDGVAESIGRWATMSTVGAEPSGLYFDVFDPNIAFVNIQHPQSGVDRMIQISAVPESETYAMMLVGIGLVALRLRRKMRRSARGLLLR